MGQSRNILVALFAYSSLASATSNVCSSGVYAKYVPFLKGCAAAQSWCSTHYPVAPVATTTTVHQNSPTTVTDTTVTSHTTSTHTSYSTAVITTTVAAGGGQKIKRRHKTSPAASNPTSTALSSLRTCDGSVAKTVCSCIENPRTTTITTTASDVSTVHTTATSVVHDDTTTTITTTSVSTTTTTPSNPTPTCSDGCYQAGADTDTYIVSCGVTQDTDIQQFYTASSIFECLTHCNGVSGCGYAQFDESSGQCFTGDAPDGVYATPGKDSARKADCVPPER